MQQIKMRRQPRHGDRSRHGEAVLKQRPVERFAVEGDQHGPLRNAPGDFVQNRMLLAEIAHEKLFDLQRAGVPPCQANQKRIRPRAARQPCRFRIEKKPFRRIGQRRPHALRERFVAATRKQFQAYLGNFGIFRRRKPVTHQNVLPVAVCGDSCAEQARQRILAMRCAQQLRARWPWPSRLQCRKPRELVSEWRHHAHNRSRMASVASFARGAKSPAGPTHDGHPCSHPHAAMSSRVFCTSNSCARKSGLEKPMPPGYASKRYKLGSKSSFAFAPTTSSMRAAEKCSAPAASGGRSPITVPRSRPSHISSSVATDSSACSRPNMPLCRSLIVHASDSSSGRSSGIQYEVVCISFSGSPSFPAPTLSCVKNLIFLKPTTSERTKTSPWE